MTDRVTSILVVDDEPAVRSVLVRHLERADFVVYEAGGVDEALAILRRFEIPLVISDLNMPGRDGHDLLKTVRKLHPTTAVLMLSADTEVGTAVACLSEGASDYLTKPFRAGEVAARVDQALERRRLRLENEAYHTELEKRVKIQATRIEELFLTGVQSLVRALEVKDPYTRGHSERVALLAAATAREYGLDDDTVRQIELGGHLHDLGKIGVRESVLNKPGPLTPDEYDHVMQHPELGWQILSPLLRDTPIALECVRSHHEKFDGRGRPEGLRGESIPLAARIMAVADAYDVMTTGRPYRTIGRVLTPIEAIVELRRFSLTQFDPIVVRTFANMELARTDAAAQKAS